MNTPRQEHPKPQFRRDSWKCLNGKWFFEIDNTRSGDARGYTKPEAVLNSEILVPFSPESELSGIGNKDYMLGLWYQKKVILSESECAGRIFLHFGAVDYECDAYVNGAHVGYHKGGYVSFRFEITDHVVPGENTITLYARDDNRNPMIPKGKQSIQYHSVGCRYTRTTGIWQTVWLEFTPKSYLDRVKFDTDITSGTVVITALLQGAATLQTQITYGGKIVGSANTVCHGGQVVQSISLSELHLWESGAGRLYDVTFRFGEDIVHSYFGMRSLRMDDCRFYINERSVFQRLILDQGFYPDGIITAPSDAALERDIDLSMAMGFNGARLHEKIFEERFLYHCDRKGYLVWGEYPNWGLDHSRPEAIYGILPEWLEELQRDYNHPSIIGWCPFNETWDRTGHRQHDDVLRMIYRVTKAIDPSRPCIDTSGCFHVETDIFDVHDYQQDPQKLKAHYDLLMTDGVLFDAFQEDPKHIQDIGRQKYTGGPTFISEFGGIRWSSEAGDGTRRTSWGYGKDVVDVEEFRIRFRGLCDALLDNHRMFGFCYTQLTDVEQEQNGLYTYDRVPKFDPEWIRSVVSRKAAIED